MQALNDKYADQGVVALVINVLEDEETASTWKQSVEWEIPMLLDLDGKVAERYAPEGLLPDLPRNQIPIASNLIIDRDGNIQFYSLLDSRNFDARLVALTERLEALLAAE